MCGANSQFRDQLGRNKQTWWRRRKLSEHMLHVCLLDRSIWGRSVDMFPFKAVWNWWWLFTCWRFQQLSTKMWRLRWSVGFIQRRETNHVNLKPEICVKTTEFYLLWDSDQSVCLWSYWALSHSWATQAVSAKPQISLSGSWLIHV